MVEAAKAQNPFATSKPTELEASNHCPHMARLGVCLEPAMCFLIHSVPGDASLSTQAKAFNPFAAGISTASKEFTPPVAEQEQSSQQAGIVSMLSRAGLEAQVDQELGTIFIAQFEQCSCCHGLINNCRGEICEDLGMCFCVSESFHQDEDD